MNEHFIVAPIVIPFVTGALILLFDDRARAGKFSLSMISAGLQLVLAIQLLVLAKAGTADGAGGISFYLLGDWLAPMGIVLVLDRLSAMMLVLTSLLAIPSLIYARAGWHRQGQHYFALFQFLLMGLNGAFLTGDLFNLFVFFEILLAASYGLLLHGSGQTRVQAGLHYIAINLAASLLFLLGVSIIYGITGTLNMAHLSNMMSQISPQDRPFLHAALSLLAVAFLIKAGSWPLSFWLPGAYMAASAPVGAMFAIMTKVGIYAILRLAMLMFGETAGPSAGFGAPVLVVSGLATLIFGLLGVLASQGLGRMAAHMVLISSGTILAVIGFALAGGGEPMLAGALYYMIGSTLACGALFLMIEPMSREDGSIAAMLALTRDAYGLDESEADSDFNLEIPVGIAILSLCFALCVLALAGLPPLPGFIGKVAMIQGSFDATGLSGWLRWAFVTLILLSSFATVLGLARIGIETFWATEEDLPPILALEIAPVIALLAALGVLTVKAEATLRYTSGTSAALHHTSGYAYGVFAEPRTDDRPTVEVKEIEASDAEGAQP